MILFLALGSCLDTELVLEVVIERRLLTDFCCSLSAFILDVLLTLSIAVDLEPMRLRIDSLGGEMRLRSIFEVVGLVVFLVVKDCFLRLS